MAGYTSIMVKAYSLATGKSIQESLTDLAIDHLIDSSEINQPLQEANYLASSLSQDVAGVFSWPFMPERHNLR